MDNNETRPFQSGKAPSPEQLAAFERLTKMLKGGQQEYVPLLKALKSIGIEPMTENIVVDGEEMECIVIPIKELMFKEWQHMSGNTPLQPQREGI